MKSKKLASGEYRDVEYSSEKRKLDDVLQEYPHCIVDIGQGNRSGRLFIETRDPLNIMIGLEDSRHTPSVCQILQSQGFVRVKDHERIFPDQRYFVRLRPSQPYTELEEGKSLPPADRVRQTHHIHVVPQGCRFWQHHIGMKHKEAPVRNRGESA